jgi:hypothetical protein
MNCIGYNGRAAVCAESETIVSPNPRSGRGICFS